MFVKFKNRQASVACLAFLSTLALLLNGCVTKSQADAHARMAFLAGQQQATMRMQQAQQMQQQQQPPEEQAEQPLRALSVTFTGPVQNSVVPWRVGLMLTQAIVGAKYVGQADPSAIVIHRSGLEIPMDPKQLLRGENFLLEAGDVIEMRQ